MVFPRIFRRVPVLVHILIPVVILVSYDNIIFYNTNTCKHFRFTTLEISCVCKHLHLMGNLMSLVYGTYFLVDFIHCLINNLGFNNDGRSSHERKPSHT